MDRELTVAGIITALGAALAALWIFHLQSSNTWDDERRGLHLYSDSLLAQAARTDSIWEDSVYRLERQAIQTRSQLDELSSALDLSVKTAASLRLQLAGTRDSATVVTVIDTVEVQGLTSPRYTFADTLYHDIAEITVSGVLVPPNVNLEYQVYPLPTGFDIAIGCRDGSAFYSVTPWNEGLQVEYSDARIDPEVCFSEDRPWYDRWWVGSAGVVLLLTAVGVLGN